MTTIDHPKPRRRWLRFSLRAVLLAVLAIALPLGWGVHRAREQSAAVAALSSAGCKIQFATREPLTVLERLRAWLGEAEPRNVIGIAAGENTSDTELANLRVLSQLRELNLEHSKATDAGLVQLEGLTRLEALSLRDTPISDAGLAHLARLTQLEYLFLDNTHVTDAGLAKLAGLTGLRALFLDKTRISDAGLIHLRSLPDLIELSLYDTQVTDAGVEELYRVLWYGSTICHGPSPEPSE